MEVIEPKINIILGKNLYRDNLVYELVYNYLQTNTFSFGTVIGNIYPYYKYVSDNLFIKYDEDILNEYLNNMNVLYKDCYENNKEIENNLLIIDTQNLNLNTPFWIYFLENHKLYKTTIIFVMNEIMYTNIEKIKKYSDDVYMIKTVYNKFNYVCKVYETFFKDIISINSFDNLYDISLKEYTDVFHFDAKNNMYSIKSID